MFPTEDTETKGLISQFQATEEVDNDTFQYQNNDTNNDFYPFKYFHSFSA